MLTVEQCLSLSELSSLRLAGGAGGLNRTVEFCHVIEEPDVEAWVSPGLFALSAGHPIREGTRGQSWLKDLQNYGVSAVAVALGRYLQDLPASMIDQANELNLPLFELPWDVPFIHITSAIHREIIHQQTLVLRNLIDTQQRITEAAISATSQPELLQKLSRITHRRVRLVKHESPSGFPLPSMPDTAVTLSEGISTETEPEVGRQVALVTNLFLLREQVQMRLEWDARSRYLSRVLFGQAVPGWDDDPLWHLNPHQKYWLFALTLPSPTIHGTLRPNPEANLFRQTVWRSLTETQNAFLTINEAHGILTGVVESSTMENHDLVTKLEDIVQRHSESAGVVSEPVKVQDLAPTYHALAKIVPFTPRGHVMLAHDMIYPTVIAKLPEETMQILVNTTWARVMDPKLRETLDVWLEEAGNRTRVTRRLKIHRNTLRNRLNQIEKLLGHELTAELVAQLYLARDWKKSSGTLNRTP